MSMDFKPIWSVSVSVCQCKRTISGTRCNGRQKSGPCNDGVSHPGIRSMEIQMDCLKVWLQTAGRLTIQWIIKTGCVHFLLIGYNDTKLAAAHCEQRGSAHTVGSICRRNRGRGHDPHQPIRGRDAGRIIRCKHSLTCCLTTKCFIHNYHYAYQGRELNRPNSSTL